MKNTVFLVYHGYSPGKDNLYGVYSSKRLARLAAEGFVDAPRAWFGDSCVHVGEGGWSVAHIEEWAVRNSARMRVIEDASNA